MTPDELKGRRIALLTVDRALRVLEMFPSQREWTGAELVRATGYQKTVLYRLLSALEGRGFIERDADTRVYRVGPRSRDLFDWDDKVQLLWTLTAPEMRRFVDQFGETAWLAVQKGHEALGIDVIESPQVLRATLPPRQRHPLHRGAAGKAILAFMPAAQQARVLRDVGEHDPVIIASLQRELLVIRDRGFAESESEIYEHVAGMSAPLFDASGQVIASLGTLGPAVRLTVDWRRRVAPSLLAAAARISSGMAGNRIEERGLSGPGSRLPLLGDQ